MLTIVGIRFKKAGKIYYFAPSGINISKGDYALVETVRGLELGEVVIGPRDVKEEELILPLKSVIRVATEKDMKQLAKNKEKEKEAFQICLEKIAYHKLPMKLVDVEYTFDSSKIVFFFTADGRVDFRALVKDLAPIFKTRIELRQIGVRDEAKLINGIGSCGRTLCCASFLGDFIPVSIRMAKDQNLSLNPVKISGICGRLLCCLNYENDLYKKDGDLYIEKEKATYTVAEPPGIGKTVVTNEGFGKVLKIDKRNHRVKVQLDDSSRTIDLDWADIVSPEEE